MGWESSLGPRTPAQTPATQPQERMDIVWTFKVAFQMMLGRLSC